MSLSALAGPSPLTSNPLVRVIEPDDTVSAAVAVLSDFAGTARFLYGRGKARAKLSVVDYSSLKFQDKDGEIIKWGSPKIPVTVGCGRNPGKRYVSQSGAGGAELACADHA